MHSASTIYMGSTRSKVKEVDNVAGDPATFKAGLCVHQKSDGTISLAAADGSKLGISLGRSLSSTKRTAICRRASRYRSSSPTASRRPWAPRSRSPPRPARP
jgi:hypothetical protein